tara:strand:- start:24 stop:212 length:189 start_codon:yes stop_codon:yes gene_type:complete
MPIVGRIVRDSQNECLIKKGKYWNIEVIDVRWFKEDKPTNKGIRLNIDEAKLLLEVLRRELE